MYKFFGINEDLWDRVRGLGSETCKGCELAEFLVVQTCLSGSGIILLFSWENCHGIIDKEWKDLPQD